MTDVFSPEKRSSVMRRVLSKDTSPELKVRKALTVLGWKVLVLWDCEMRVGSDWRERLAGLVTACPPGPLVR